MSESDKYDRDAAELLPCYVETCGSVAAHSHHFDWCPASCCEAVAVALRAQGVEIERLRALIDMKGIPRQNAP